MIGNLIINVFNESLANPVSGAKVDIFENDKQIESLTTDISGQTETIELEAPPGELSLVPQEEERPFSTYDIRITAEGMETLTINGVEIFEGTTAIQDASLGETSNIYIPDNNLWTPGPPKIPEDEVKPLPEASGYVVLNEVVVPEFIVVHAGVPSNTSAPNYWVPFKDYIKNVASSEIYSTWPRATLQANILAIISFTLNRVFTEWYRGQGKNFTITNSTQFDQAFSYGRNIFKEISDVVDNLFTNYITREGIMQPLFTQYCDGRTSNCPGWLSQWGSASLGEQGKDYMTILKNYYGNIYIDKAPIVSGVPVSYPGHSLQIGSTGNDVRTIQNQLNSISTHYPAIPKLRADGIYGQQTAEGVKTFQRIFNMPQTGVVDFATWYRISHIYVAINKLATLV